MKTLFARAGVDYGQWKALSRTLLRSDFRPPGPNTETYSIRTIGGFLLMVLTYGLFGLGAAVVIFINDDVLLTGTVTLSYLAMLLLTALLSQHSSAIAATTDHALLAPRPVSSQTFFAVRLTNVVFHTVLITTLMAYPPVIAYTFAHGVSVTRALAAAVAIYGFAFAVTFMVVALYGSLLQIFGAARIQKVVSYAQLLVGILAYGGVVLILQVAGTRVIGAAAMPREPWLLLVPPAWFASYMEVATGQADWNTWARVLLSIVCLTGLFLALRGPLGMSYAARLGELATVGGEPNTATTSGPAWLFTRGEARAAALLVRAHFRHDLRVRLGVLAIVPLTFMYMLIGMRNGASSDPFVEGGGAGVDLVALAVLFFPSMIVQQFSGTDAFRAAWIYFATPADRASLVTSLKNVIVAFFYLPYVLLLAVLFTWRFDHAGHALVHAAFLGLVGYLALQIGALIEPRLPFALPAKKSANNAAMIAWMLIAVVGGNAVLWVLVDRVYGDWSRVALFGAMLVAISFALDRAVRLVARRRYQAFEFA